jgi:N-acetylmuramoyl-L-alanine amidase
LSSPPLAYWTPLPRRAAACFAALLALCSAEPARSESALTDDKGVLALGAVVEERGATTRLAFELTRKIDAAAFPVARPERIVVETPELSFRMDPAVGQHAGGKAKGLIRSFRFGQFAPGKSRIVIDLARPAQLLKAACVDGPAGPRLEIDLSETDASAFAAAAEAARARHAAVDAPSAAPAPSPAPVVGDAPVLVIDPGHGGVDIGASGKRGEMEKMIVLEFARALRARLESKRAVRVILTRDDDVFIPLEERVRFARSHDAALFLSIHADTLGEASVEGATVYTLSAKASDAEAARIAETENRADQAAGVLPPAEAEEIGDILLELTRRETKAFSRQFAEALIERWRDAGSLNKNPNRAAGFVVLKAHDVPSVLLELGYLSSERDLARLSSPQWRERAAEATATAIEAYFSARRKAAQSADPAATRAAAQTARPQ